VKVLAFLLEPNLRLCFAKARFMKPLATTSSALGKNSARSPLMFHWVFFSLFLVSFLVAWLQAANVIKVGESGWPEAFLAITALLTTLVSLSRQLPAQNVLLVAVIIAAVAGTVQSIGALTGIPFGPYLYTDAARPKFFNVLPWAVPLAWIIILLNARGVARLILRPWRKSRLYGFRLIGVTAALAVMFDLGWEPYATQVKHFWLWNRRNCRYSGTARRRAIFLAGS